MAQTCLGAHTCHMAPVGPICAVQGEHSQDLGWNVTKGVIKEDSMREGLHVTYQFRGQDFFRSPEEAGSSAQNPSKAGGTEGVLGPGLPSALTSAASSSSNHPPPALANPLPALPLRMHFADINTFMAQPVIKVTRPCPLPCVASLPSQEESTAVNDTPAPPPPREREQHKKPLAH